MLSLYNYGKPSAVTNLGGAYLIQAVELYSGNLPSYYQRGPVYPYLIAILFKLGGINFSIAHWLNQFFYFLTIGAIFIIGKKLFGKWVACASSISIIVSISLFTVSWQLGVAFLWPLFILISFILYLKSVSDKKSFISFFSGLVFGFAILTKESSIFYVYFPILLMIFLEDHRLKFILNNFSLYCLGIILSISPWVIFLISRDQNLSIMLGEFKASGISFFGYSSTLNYLNDIIIKGGLSTVKELSRSEPFFPLMLIGLCYIIYSSFISKNKSGRVSGRIYLSLLIPSIPILFAYGLFSDGIRQIVLPVVLFHISFGIFVVKMFNYSKKYKLVLFFLLFSSMGVFYFLNIDKVNRLILEGPSYIIKKRITGKFGLDVVLGGRFNNSIANAAVWTMNNIPMNSKLIIGGKFDHALVFFTNREYQYFGRNNPSFYNVAKISKNIYSSKGVNQQKYNREKNHRNRIIQLTTTKKFVEVGEQFRYRSQLYLLYYQDLKEFLLELTKEKKYLFKFQNGKKIIFPIAENAIKNVTREIYSKEGVTILESLPLNYDFDEIINNNHTNLWAKGNTSDLSWLNSSKDMRWLFKNYRIEFDRYYNYLIKEGVDFKEVFPDTSFFNY